MLTDLQLIANRENAQHSTGPRTPEGKKRSSLNALRHGLTGQVVVMPYEDLQAYNAFLDRYIKGLDPENEPEKQLAVDMANNVWKLNRCNSIESGIYAMGHHDNADRNNVDDPEVHSALTAATTYLENSKQLESLTARRIVCAAPSINPPNCIRVCRTAAENGNRRKLGKRCALPRRTRCKTYPTIQPKMASFCQTPKSTSASIAKRTGKTP